MSTKRVVIEGEERLEGLLKEGSREAGVVICHPHPLYGGSMHNNVVNAIEAGYSAGGYTTLRFNFRGVEGSSGDYDGGDGEVRDLVAAFQFLKGLCPSNAHLVLSGYSFGAWIAARAVHLLAGVSSIFLVALPIKAFGGSGDLESFHGPVHLVAGTHDDIAFARDIQELHDRLITKEKYIKMVSTTHFFHSREREVTEYIEETLADGTKEDLS